MKQEIDLNCKLINLKFDLIVLHRMWFAFASTFHCLRVESAQRRPIRLQGLILFDGQRRLADFGGN